VRGPHDSGSFSTYASRIELRPTPSSSLLRRQLRSHWVDPFEDQREQLLRCHIGDPSSRAVGSVDHGHHLLFCSPGSGNGVLRHYVHIYLNAESWPGRDVDIAIANCELRNQEIVPKRIVGAVEFDDRFVLCRHRLVGVRR